MRSNARTALAAALATLLSTAAFAQQAPINPANLPSPLPTKGITDTGGIASTKPVTGSGFLTPNTAYDLATVGGNIRNTYLQTTLAPSVDTTNIWENANSFVYVNGPGVAHWRRDQRDTRVSPGKSWRFGWHGRKALESSMAEQWNSGRFHREYLAAATNGATSNTNTMQGFVYIPQNLNTTAGKVLAVISAALTIEPTLIGAGARQPIVTLCVFEIRTLL